MGSRHPNKTHLHKDDPVVLDHPDGKRVETLCASWCIPIKVVSLEHYRVWTVDWGYSDDTFCSPCREESAAG